MPTADERLAFVEGRMTEQSQTFLEIRDEMREMRGEMRGEMREMRGEMREMRGEMRAEILDIRGELRDAIRRLDDRMSRQFMWLVGIQITTLAAIVVALISRG